MAKRARGEEGDEARDAGAKLLRLNVITDPSIFQALRRAGYSTEVLALPDTVIRAITEEGLGVDALRAKYRGNPAMERTIANWMQDRVFWEAVAHRDIELPLLQGIASIRETLKAHKSSVGPEMRAYLLSMQRNHLPSMLTALYKRFEEENFDEAAYRGYFHLGASDVINVVLNAMVAALSCGQEKHYAQRGHLELAGGSIFFHIDADDSYKWHIIVPQKNIDESIYVKTTEQRREAAHILQDRWTVLIAQEFFGQKRAHPFTLAISTPPPSSAGIRPFANVLISSNVHVDKNVDGLIAGVNTGFMIAPRRYNTPNDDEDKDRRAMPPPPPQRRPKEAPCLDEVQEEEEEDLGLEDYDQETYKKFLRQRFFEILSDLPSSADKQ